MQNHESHPGLALLRRLLAIPSPSGRESALAQAVREELDTLGYTHETDAVGNVLVRVEGQNAYGPLCCLAAHIDEIGMVVTTVHDDGTLAVDRSGGLFPWKLGEGPITILGDREEITGVLSMGSTHRPDAADSAVKWSDVRVITGLSPQALQTAGVRPGSTAVPVQSTRGPVLFGDPDNPLVAAWTFDDRLGVITLLRLLRILREQEITPQLPLLIAFTVHEEGGGHGAKILAMRERPITFIAIDGCPMPPGAPLALDGRPGIWSKDRLAHYDQPLLVTLMDAAERAGTALQPVVYDGAASDASLVYAAGGAFRIACFGHVRENSHGYEVAPLAVFDAMLNTLLQFVRDWDGS
jgi:putative aminopeptidase FrvX